MVDKSIQKKILVSFIYSFIGRYSNILISLFVTSILARLISPTEFGIVAIINIFLVFFNNLAEMGLGASIIQKKVIKKFFIDSLFLFTLFIGGILAISFIAFSKYILVVYYQNIIYEKLSFYVAINILISTLLIVPRALIVRWKRFKIQGIQIVISNIISGVIAIVLAYLDFSYYSIIFQGIFMNLLLLLLICFNIRYSPSIFFKKEYLKEVFSYSSFVFSSNLINYFGRNLDKILIGKYFGARELGYYDRGYRLMLFPLSIFPYILNSILHPIFARYQNNFERIYVEYLKILKELVMIGVFIAIFTFFSAEEIIFLLYGKQWDNTVIILKILSISIIVQIGASTTGGIYLALGESKKMFFYTGIYSLLLIFATILGIYKRNIVLLCIYLVLSFFIGGYILYRGLLKIFKKNIFLFLKEFFNSYILSILLILFNFLYREFICIENLYLNLILKLLLNLSLLLLFYIKKIYLIYKILIKKEVQI